MTSPADPALPLQEFLIATLRKNAALKALVDGRVFDQAPAKPTFPYVTLGEDQVIGDDADCNEESAVIARIHGWSRTPGFPEVKQIATAIRAALRAAVPVTIEGFDEIIVEFIQVQFLRDPDGLTRHSVSEFRFVLNHS